MGFVYRRGNQTFCTLRNINKLFVTNQSLRLGWFFVDLSKAFNKV